MSHTLSFCKYSTLFFRPNLDCKIFAVLNLIQFSKITTPVKCKWISIMYLVGHVSIYTKICLARFKRFLMINNKNYYQIAVQIYKNYAKLQN